MGPMARGLFFGYISLSALALTAHAQVFTVG